MRLVAAACLVAALSCPVAHADTLGQQCHYRTAANGAALPDPACTPGATDPRVTQENIGDTICVKGYTKTVRPPSLSAFKRRSAIMYGYADSLSTAELDHLIPLSLGGSSDPANLWIEPGASPNPKDDVELELMHEVCSGQRTLADAQQAIARDWTTAVP